MTDYAFRTGGEVPHIPGATTIPCHHIRMGDILFLQGRPCQVTRISISSVTGQYRYLGVGLFDKQLREESSFVSNPTPDVIVQTMLSPIFKQYRVLDLQDGTISAMTELGDIKTGIPVVDQADLLGRLHRAFNNGLGSVRVLVLVDGDRELIVDMKVIFGSSPGDRPVLHEAILTSNKSVFAQILSTPEKIHDLDQEGRTALFSAVMGRRKDVVDLLLQKEIDVNLIDMYGKTALDVAVAEDPSIAIQLLRKGASPTVGIDSGILDLLSASAEGNRANVESLLDSGVNVNGCDRLGLTALHEAASFGHDSIVTQLIQHGADVNARVALGKDTVLHIAIRGDDNYRGFIGQDSRSKSPVLSSSHVEVVKTLLRNGATTSQRRHDGRTVEDLVSEDLSKPCLSEARKHVLQEIEKTLKSPPKVQAKVQGESNVRVPRLDEEKVYVCGLFNVRIQYHTSDSYLPRELSVGSFIYRQSKDGPERSGSVQPVEWAKEMNGAEYWRWIHLPANNKIWVKDMVRTLYSRSEISLTSGHFKEVIKFIDGSYNEFRSSTSDIRLRRPSFLRCSKSEHVFSIVIPYFDVEAVEDYINRKSNKNDQYKKKRELERLYRYRKPVDEPEDLHIPYSLDQSYYLFLNDSTERDKTQVVVKYAELQEKRMKITESESTRTSGPQQSEDDNASHGQPETSPRVKKLLMVNQMWLWKINQDTFITAFPDRLYNGSEVKLPTQISQDMAEDLPVTIDSTITKILDRIVGFVDAPSNAGLDENVFGIFEESIAYQAQAERECFNNFSKWQNVPWIRDIDKSQPWGEGNSYERRLKRQELNGEDQENEMCSISKEVEHLSEIKDIRDELRMIERVLVDQRNVITQFQDILEDDDAKSKLKITLQGLNGRISKVDRLGKDALWVENSLKNLLDLKQKQGNLNEARDTRWLVNEEHKRQEAGERQNRLLFVFTIVTVVFTPVSFATSFLAIPSWDFPQNNSGDAIGWRWWQIFVSMHFASNLPLIFTNFWAPLPKTVDKFPYPHPRYSLEDVE
ncbi:hypothetical protein F4815DRAFT_441468 [Daldinia loculata]|nr:hypothetical protein F4815DRAFT_441468 [Daldinia loculata]